MNYIKLLNQFWKLRRSKRVTSLQSDLYYSLIHECNQRDWENPFECSNVLIVASIGISEPSLIDARNRLKQLGLIDFIGGQRNEKSPVYTLLYLNDLSRNRAPTLDETEEQPEEKGEHYNKTKRKSNKTKQNKDTRFEKKLELVNPFSEKFLDTWVIWKDYKKKEFRFLFRSVESEQAGINELVGLSEGNELTASAIIQQSMAKGWKGFFPLKNHQNESRDQKNGFTKPGAKATGAGIKQAFNEFHSKGQ